MGFICGYDLRFEWIVNYLSSATVVLTVAILLCPIGSVFNVLEVVVLAG